MELFLVHLNEPLERIALLLRNASGAIVHTDGKVPLARSAVTPPLPRSIECGWEIDVVPNIPVQAPLASWPRGMG